MLRTVFVVILLAIGLFYAVQAPFYALLLYLWYAYFRPDLWMWGDSIQRFDLSFYIGAYTALATLVTRQRLIWNWLVALFVLFLLQAAVSASLSTHSAHSLTHTKHLAIRLLITYLIAVLVTDRRKYRILLLVMALSLAFEAGKQGWAQMFLRPGMPNTGPMPFLGDNNAVALGLLMLLPLLVALAQTTPRGWERFVHLFLLTGVLYRALTTYSRGAFLSAGALALFYWWRSQRKVVSLAVILLLGGGILGLMPTAFWDRMQTTVTYEERDDASALGRLHFWGVAVVMANDRPLLGVGPGTYGLVYDSYDSSFGAYGRNRAVHSSWFGMLAEHGYVGLLFYAGILILAFRNCRQVHRLASRGELDPELYHYGVAVEAGLVAWVIGSSFLGVPHMELPYHYVGLSLALRNLAAENGSPANGSPATEEATETPSHPPPA